MNLQQTIKHLLLILLILTLNACRDNGKRIRIATKPMTEQFILGEMVGLLIEEYTDLKPEITKGIGGGTSNIHPALMKGDFDLYPEYTGTAWQVVLKEDSILPTLELKKSVEKIYEDSLNLLWIGFYGFNNTYGLGVNENVAKAYNLKKISDLAKYPNLFTFGAEYDFFEIHKGYKEMCEAYDLKFKKTLDMDIGLKYDAIKAKKVDVLNVFTTDGQLKEANLIVLEDDHDFFPSYQCASIVRKELLDKHPQLKDVLLKMNHLLTNEEMADLNYQVDIAGKTEREVAVSFLQSKGLLNKETNYGK